MAPCSSSKPLGRGWRAVPEGSGDPLDVSLEDTELLNEVDLLTNMLIAALDSDGPLSQDQIDRVLGVKPS